MEFEKMSLADLKNAAKEKGIKGYSALKKQELIDKLSEMIPTTKIEVKEEKASVADGIVPEHYESEKSEEYPRRTAIVKNASGKAAKDSKKNSDPSVDKTDSGIGNGANGRIDNRRNIRAEERVDNRSESRPEGRTDNRSEFRSEGRADNRGESRPEGRTDNRSEFRAEGRADNRSESRPEVRTDNRSEFRAEGRADNRSESRPEVRTDNRSEFRAEGRADNRGESRSEGRYDNRTDGRNGARPDYRNSQPLRRESGSEIRNARPVQDSRPSARPVRPAEGEIRQPSAAVSGRIVSTTRITSEEREALDPTISPEIEQLDSGETKTGILEIVESGFGFIRCDNFLPGENDVYVSPAQIRKFNLKTGDIVTGNTKIRTASEKFSALLYIKSINGLHPSEAVKRAKFEELTPVFPYCRLHLETPGCTPAMRIVDLISPIGKGQRGMIVSQPKAGKTTLLKQIATALTKNYPELHVIILLIDERPEEVTDMKESIQSPNVEVIYSTFDELPENHKRVSEMVIERAKRLVEHKKDVVVLLDSITRLARAYNLTVTASGRTLSGGLDPAALHMPKKFFGAARCMREGGSLTILATALVETGSRMDDVVFEEFKGTGNMELVLDRNLSERRIFPAIDLPKSSTRRDDLLLSADEIEANNNLRRAFNSSKSDDAVERIINMFAHTRSNKEFIELVKKTKLY